MNYYYMTDGNRRDNIGDTLQGLAAKAFLPDEAIVVNREALSELDTQLPGLLLANGWYMHNWDKFPPPQSITPIYVSVHIARPSILHSEGIRQHFKQHAPIGCRDKRTLMYFLAWGIPAYHSNCLSITTKKRASIDTSGEYLFVDDCGHSIPVAIKEKLKEMIGCKFKEISHTPENTHGSFDEYATMSMDQMNQLLELYCKAKLVITTKIHCALPCLGMGANVVLIHPNPNDPRLSAIKEFTKIYSYDDILKMDKLVIPNINKRKLRKYQRFLSDVTLQSVEKGYNIMAHPQEIKMNYIRFKSEISALLFRQIIVIMYKLKLGSFMIRITKISNSKKDNFCCKIIKKIKSKVPVFSHINSLMTNTVTIPNRKDILDYSALNNRMSGITDKKYGDEDIIVSLTTYGKRLNQVYLTIESLMQQSLKPNKIVLWLGESDYNKSLPPLLKRQVDRGLEILSCKDIRSYTKLIPSLQKYSNDVIITVDDDVFYDVNMLENLVVAYIQDTGCIYFNRGHKMKLLNNGILSSYRDWEWCMNDLNVSPLNFPTGTGGVLYPPHCFNEEVYNEEVFTNICPFADDVWFKAMALFNNMQCRKVETISKNGCEFLENALVQGNALSQINNEESKNDVQIKAVFEKYNLYDKLK